MPAIPAINNLRTVLTAPVGIADTTVQVASTAGWVSPGHFSVDQEIFYYTSIVGNTFTGCVRGWDSTTPAAHPLLDVFGSPNTVSLRIIAKHIKDSTYQNTNPTPAAVGGIPAGTTFPTPLTVQEMFDKLLYPYLDPTFSSFSIFAIATQNEVGYTIPAAVTFLWGTTTPGNVQANSIQIQDVTLSQVLASGLANDGAETLTMSAPVTRTTHGTHVFQISGQSTHATAFSRTLTFSWMWRMYYGSHVNPTIIDDDISMMTGVLKDTYPGTYPLPAGGYKYICFADEAGGQINMIKDAGTGLEIPMADDTDDPSYSNVDGGGYHYALVSFENQQGITTNYRVYRSKNTMGGAFSVTIT